MHLCEKDNSECKRCDIVYILKDYIKPLIQLLSNDLKYYNMRLETTKCLNTGVLLMVFMAGQKGLDAANYCDNSDVIQRQDNNQNIISKMQRGILSNKFKNRQIYYILISDGTFQRGEETLYFPGHVFIIEKMLGAKTPLYNLYQSYINKYDLKGHFDNNKGTMRVSYDYIKTILSNIGYIVTNGTWDKNCTRYWHMLTKVDASQYEGLSSNIYICFKGLALQQCAKNIQMYVNAKLKSLNHEMPIEHTFEPPLSPQDLEKQLKKLLVDIKQNVK